MSFAERDDEDVKCDKYWREFFLVDCFVSLAMTMVITRGFSPEVIQIGIASLMLAMTEELSFAKCDDECNSHYEGVAVSERPK